MDFDHDVEMCREVFLCKRRKVYARRRTYPCSSIPLNGWIHPCEKCNMWTGSSYVKNGLEIPMCKTCLNSANNEDSS